MSREWPHPAMGARVVVALTDLAWFLPVGQIAKSRNGLRHGFDTACADFQGLTGPPASCKSLYLLLRRWLRSYHDHPVRRLSVVPLGKSRKRARPDLRRES